MKADIFDRIMSTRLLKPLNPFYTRFKEQLLYLFFGMLTVLVNMLAFWFLISFVNVSPLAANIIAWIVGVVFAYLTNRTWVFSDKAHNAKGVIREAVTFTVGRLGTLGLEELLLWLGIDKLGLNSMVVKVVAQVLVIIGNYVVSKYFVFRKNGMGDERNVEEKQ